MAIERIDEKYDHLSFLIADDDEEVRNVLKMYLESFGFKNVCEAKNGMQALEMIRNPKRPIDIVLSDWEMPSVNGIILLQAIRKNPRRKHTKFIMITSQIEKERAKISQAVRWNVDGYIVKPFSGHTLREKILQAIKKTEEDLLLEKAEGE